MGNALAEDFSKARRMPLVAHFVKRGYLAYMREYCMQSLERSGNFSIDFVPTFITRDFTQSVATVRSEGRLEERAF